MVVSKKRLQYGSLLDVIKLQTPRLISSPDPEISSSFNLDYSKWLKLYLLGPVDGIFYQFGIMF